MDKVHGRNNLNRDIKTAPKLGAFFCGGLRQGKKKPTRPGGPCGGNVLRLRSINNRIVFAYEAVAVCINKNNIL